MCVGDLIFNICLIVAIYELLIKILELIDYKLKNSNEKKEEVTGLCKCLNDKYESILDEEDLKDLSNDELISFNDIEESDLINGNK